MKLLSGNLYGDILENKTVAGLKLTETLYESGLSLAPHSHELDYFCFVLTGNFTETYAKHARRSCSSSTLVFHPGGETHSDYFHARVRCFNIQMNSAWSKRLREDIRIMNSPIAFEGGPAGNLATKLYREFRQSDEFSPLAIEALTLEILVETSRCFVNKSLPVSSGVPPVWIKLAREIISEQFCERLTLVDIAALINIHPVHLAREFRKHFRCTIGECIRRRRIEVACRKLSGSNMPIAEIALQVGFFDQSHFARTFKLHTGFTPARYRTAFYSR